MHRVSAAVALVMVGVLVLASAGCVDEAKYNAVLLRNREQEKLIHEKEAENARLQERIRALEAQRADAQRMLEEKDEHLASIMSERDEIRSAFSELRDAYMKLVERPAPVAGGPIPGPVAIEIEELARTYSNIFEFDRANGRLRFASDITFDSGSNVVQANARAAITKLASILSSEVASRIMVTVVGHTDTDPVRKAATKSLLRELGKSEDNMGLSVARAESVAEILKSGGIAAQRIVTQGMGTTQPIADNRTAEGKAKNRRVEIFLTMGA